MFNKCLAFNIFKRLKVKNIVFLLLIFAFIIPKSSSAIYPDRRPNAESFGIDSTSCLAFITPLIPCIQLYATSGVAIALAQQATGKGPCSNKVADAVFKKINLEKANAGSFRNNTIVGNHMDLDRNGLNDFSQNNTAQTCLSLLGKDIPSSTLRLNEYGRYQREVCATEQCPHKEYPDFKETYTTARIKQLPGCEVDSKGDIKGTTFELFDVNYVFEDGVNVFHTGSGSRNKLSQGECGWLDTTRSEEANKRLACAYEVDDLICAEGVYCTWDIFKLQLAKIVSNGADGSDTADFLTNVLGSQFRNKLTELNGRVANGVDNYSVDEKIDAEIVSCSSKCEIKDDQLECQGGIDVSKCSICYTADSCVSAEGKLQDCDPGTQGQAKVCGYNFNPRYLAHCIPKMRKMIDPGNDMPGIISPYCTGLANLSVVNSAFYGDVRNVFFAGRAIRCFEQTVLNMFYGVEQEAPPGGGLGKDITLKCVDKDGTRTVTRHADCRGGIFVGFQDYVKNLVTVILILSVTIYGVLFLFGVLGDVRQLFKLVFLFGIVSYFVFGSGWRDGYFDVLIKGGTELGQIAFNNVKFSLETNDSNVTQANVDAAKLPAKLRCDPMLESPNRYVIGGKTIDYSSGEKRYMIWDVLDCRINNFFGAEDVGGNFVKFLASSIFSLIGFFLIAIILGPLIWLMFLYMVLKILFVMASNFIIILLLVFVSPLIIPLVLFNNPKAKGIFDKWLKNLIGYSLVPIVIFMMLAIFFPVLDHALYGNKVGDVFRLDSTTNELVISDECSETYLPCLLHKMESAKFTKSKIMGIPMPFSLSWFSTSFLTSAVKALFRLLFVVGIMLLVFNEIMKNVTSSLFGVSIMDGDIARKALKALKHVKGGVLKAGKAGNNIRKKLKSKKFDT